MPFPNPFKGLFRKKNELKDSVEKNEAVKNASDKPAEKSAGFFKSTRERRAQVHALEQRFEQIKLIEDLGERLLQYGVLRVNAAETLERVQGKNGLLPGLATELGGVGLTITSIFMLNPVLFAGGLMMSRQGSRMIDAKDKPKTWTIFPSLAKDCDALEALVKKADNAISDIIIHEDLAKIAKSPQLDRATYVFPALKDRFLMAAAKDKILNDQKPVQDVPTKKPDNKGPIT